jgi:hypothetical protein
MITHESNSLFDLELENLYKETTQEINLQPALISAARAITLEQFVDTIKKKMDEAYQMGLQTNSHAFQDELTR